MPLEPGKPLEDTIRNIEHVFGYSKIHYWLAFGALYGLIRNKGVIPDGDLDLCTYYGSDWIKIKTGFEHLGYTLSKAILNDIDNKNILYCGFNKPGMPHICVSFWYPYDKKRFWLHDEKFELKPGEIGVPTSGYFFKGIPDTFLEDKRYFKKVEWPGIPQITKISVPVFPGNLFDYMYPGWGYIEQRYNIKEHTIEDEKCRSIYRHGAVSPFRCHLKSMKDWTNTQLIKEEFEKSENEWFKEIKKLS